MAKPPAPSARPTTYCSLSRVRSRSWDPTLGGFASSKPQCGQTRAPPRFFMHPMHSAGLSKTASPCALRLSDLDAEHGDVVLMRKVAIQRLPNQRVAGGLTVAGGIDRRGDVVGPQRAKESVRAEHHEIARSKCQRPRPRVHLDKPARPDITGERVTVGVDSCSLGRYLATFHHLFETGGERMRMVQPSKFRPPEKIYRAVADRNPVKPFRGERRCNQRRADIFLKTDRFREPEHRSISRFECATQGLRDRFL